MSSLRFPRAASRAASFVALAALASTAAACGSSGSENAVPVITDVEAPATAKVGASGNYEIVLLITCNDPDGVISQVRVDIPGFASPTINAGNKPSFTKQPLGLQIDGKAPKGVLKYDVVVVDDDGGSASKELEITLE